MADRVKETAVAEAERVKALANQAARSGAYIYPIKGIYYFLSHKELWRPLTAKLAPVLTTGIGVTTFMFLFTYLPQVAVLAFVNGPLAALSSILLVLSESSTITTLLTRTFFTEGALVDTFDGTLMARKMDGLVSNGRDVKPGRDFMHKLGKLTKSPFAKFSPQALIRYVMYLPLNFIPVIGTVLFVILQGRRKGPDSHGRYFQLKGMNASQKEKFVEERKGAYTAFGIPATLLEMIPIAGIFFTFTNTVGAALWAADLEQHGSTAPNLQEQAKKVY